MTSSREKTIELLHRIPEGDERAMGAVLERHRSPLRRMIQCQLDRALAARLDASDVVQDVLLEAVKRIPEYLKDPHIPFHLWLRRIARDRLVDLRRFHLGAAKRAVGRERRLDASLGAQSSFDLVGRLADREITPAANAIRRELACRFMAVLESMDEADREIIYMRHFEHLTNREVAIALECSDATAGMRYLRALRRLRSQLKQIDESLAQSEPLKDE